MKVSLGDCRMAKGAQRKRCSQRSQYVNVVLHLRFVLAYLDLDKHLICLSLDTVVRTSLSVPV
jgi:hypothetical protein